MITLAATKPLPDFDEDGLIKDPALWDETVAQATALAHGVGKLTDNHWRVIRALRAHYVRFGVAPAMHNVCRELGQNRFWVHELFQTCLNAWRVAGLPNPGEEAKTYLSGA
jgi:tRNA 2-thiouridine synthesizing protein E